MTWLLYAIGATILLAAVPVLAKAGAKKSDPALSSAISGLAVLVMMFIQSPGSLSSFSFASYGTRELNCLLLSGITAGLAAYFFFMAIGNGELINIAPVIKCSMVISLLAGFFLWDSKFTNMTIAKMILIVIGTVVMVAGGSGKNYKWLAHALLAAVSISASKLLMSYGFGGTTNNTNVIRCIIAIILLFGIGIGTGGIKKFKSITFLDGILLVLAGLVSVFYKTISAKAAIITGWSNVEAVLRFELLAIVLLAGICLKEKMSGKSFIGAIVIIAALFL